ncbi:hypothetical protein AAEX37_01974 [Oligella sp. MSHR50489EDL]
MNENFTTMTECVNIWVGLESLIQADNHPVSVIFLRL